MWTCQKCGEKIDNQFDSCWQCSAPKGAQVETAAPSESASAPKWRMAYRVFRGTFATWEQLFNEAADFATEVGPERVLSISHSADRSDGVVTVWYWATQSEADQ